MRPFGGGVFFTPTRPRLSRKGPQSINLSGGAERARVTLYAATRVRRFPWTGICTCREKTPSSLTRMRDLYSDGFLAPALHSATTVRNKVTNTRVPAYSLAPPWLSSNVLSADGLPVPVEGIKTSYRSHPPALHTPSLLKIVFQPLSRVRAYFLYLPQTPRMCYEDSLPSRIKPDPSSTSTSSSVTVDACTSMHLILPILHVRIVPVLDQTLFCSSGTSVHWHLS